MARRNWMLATCILSAGCVSAPSLDSDPTDLNSREVCHLRERAIKETNQDAQVMALTEIERRGFTVADCARWVEEDKQVRAAKIRKGLVTAAVAIAVTAAVVAAANSGGGGGAPAPTDYEWDWDIFYNEYGQLVAYCRGVQTGQFAETWRCNGKAQTDWRWPGK